MSETTLAARADIRKGSKSFSFASFVFSSEEREACWRLYAWCRRSDDAIDTAANRGEAAKRLLELRQKTRASFRGEDLGEHPWTGLCEIAKRYRLPESAAQDLLRGFEMDLGHAEVQSERDGILVQMKSWDQLADYCYCVAGTVGLLMCPIMGVTDPQANKGASEAAIAMGSAMQLSNIARDIREDFENGRVYLPADWLSAAGVLPPELLSPENREKTFSVVKRLLARAEDLYSQGEDGLRFLPWRAAWAVIVASTLYREIGRRVIERGSETDFSRVVVGSFSKFVLFFGATLRLLRLRIWGKSLSPGSSPGSSRGPASTERILR